MTNQCEPAYSQRAQNLLTDCKCARTADIASNPQWEIDYGSSAPFQNGRILTLKYSHISTDVLETVFYESICRLSQGKTLNFLFLLSFREIESFLRDENHLPAFGNELELRALEVFGRLKAALLHKILRGKIGLPQEKKWSKLTLADKNRGTMELFSSLNNLFPKDKNLELILAEEGTVTVKKNDFPLELDVVEALLNDLFGPEETHSPLKVIGTL